MSKGQGGSAAVGFGIELYKQIRAVLGQAVIAAATVGALPQREALAA